MNNTKDKLLKMAPTPVKKLQDELRGFKKTSPNISLDSKEFAGCMDEEDELKGFRSRFQFPLKGSIPIGFGILFRNITQI